MGAPKLDRIDLRAIMQVAERKIKSYHMDIDRTDSPYVRLRKREDIEACKKRTILSIPRNREWDMEASEMLSMIHVLLKL